MATVTSSKPKVTVTTAWQDLADLVGAGYDSAATYRLQYVGNEGKMLLSLSAIEPVGTQSYRVIMPFETTQIVAQANVWVKVVGTGSQTIMVEADETVVEP